MEHLIVDTISISTVPKAIGKLVHDEKKQLECQMDKDYQWKFILQVPEQEKGVLEGNTITVHYILYEHIAVYQ